MEPKLVADLLDVVLGGPLREMEAFRDLAVGQPFGHQLGHFGFAPAELGHARKIVSIAHSENRYRTGICSGTEPQGHEPAPALASDLRPTRSGQPLEVRDDSNSGANQNPKYPSIRCGSGRGRFGRFDGHRQL
jgi:hypothetical protein